MKLFIPLMLLMMAVSCQSISSDPVKGADKLFKELQLFATKNNFDEANAKMSKYWNAYTDDSKTTFILALRGNLSTDDNIVNFITNADFHKYPMFGIYMKNLETIAIEEAINNPSIGSPASKGILFGSLMTDYAEVNNTDEAYQTIENTYNHLRNAPELARIEFFASFKQFMKTSGESAANAFKFMNSLNSPTYTAFQRMAVESLIDYN